MGRIKDRHRAQIAEPRGAAHGGADFAKATVAKVPMRRKGGRQKGQQGNRHAPLPGQHSPARQRKGKELRGRGPMIPARHGFQLGIDHRGGGNGGQRQNRTHHPRQARQAQAEPIRQRHGC